MSEQVAAVVVPSLPDDPNLRDCVEALNAQTIRGKLRIVVSIDGRGEPPEGVRRLVDLVLTGPGSGPAAARNRGWRASELPYVMFTDADCVPEPSWAEEMLRAMRTGVGGVKGSYSRGGRRTIQRLAQVEFEERYRLLSRSEDVDLVDTYSACFTREALESVGGFDESFPLPDHEDVDLSYRLKTAGYRLVFHRPARVAHRHQPTWIAYLRMKLSRGKWRMKVVRSFPGKAASDSYTPAMLKVQLVLISLLLPVLVSSAMMPYLSLMWLAAFVITTLPLVRVTLAVDTAVAPMVPAFALCRGAALLAGMTMGLVRFWRKSC
ncbi:glycosyltransferase [Candidatus Fermentibacteria bacterium]|nr:glycosyltransferase [Candidatus Fermentibacteria bacterium]